MAFCTNCGTNVPDGIKFCTSCGTPMSVQAQPQAPPPPQQTYVQPQPAPQPLPQQAYAPPSQPAYAQPQPGYVAPAGDPNAPLPPGSKYEPITTGGYIGIFLLMLLPLINLILLIIWPCGGCQKVIYARLGRQVYETDGGENYPEIRAELDLLAANKQAAESRPRTCRGRGTCPPGSRGAGA